MKLTSYNRKKWEILIILVLCYMFIYCGRQNFGFAIIGMQRTYHLTTLDTGIIGAGMLLFYGIGQAINGALADKHSARILITLGMFFSFIFNIVTSFASGFWGFLIPWCFNGYAQSLGFASGGKIITNWFSKRERGKAFGLYLAASGFSSVVAFLVCIIVLYYYNWPWLFRLPPLLLVISGLFFYIYARDTPQEFGYVSNNVTNVTIHTSNYMYVLSNWRFHIASLTMAFTSIARYGLLFWLPAIYLSVNHDYWSSLALPLGMAMGCIITGYISDMVFNSNRIIPIIVFMLAAALTTFILYEIPNEYTLTKMSLLFFVGIFVYGPQSLLFALCPELLGNANAGTGVGIMNAYAYGFSAASEVLIGYLIHKTHNYMIVYFLVGICCILACVSSLFIIKNFWEQDKELQMQTQ